MQKKLWSGRFSKPTHSEVDQYNASIMFDCELAYEDIQGSLAHAAMLAHCKIISAEESQQLQTGLKQIAELLSADKLHFKIEDEDIHMNIERLLFEMIGDVAGTLHTARSRNDQVALDLHLYLRKKLIVIVDLLSQLQQTLLQIAETQRATILPGYTHLQRAQPVSFSQHLLAYVAMFQRDVERLQNSWQRINQCPLGAGALAGTSFAIDRNYVAKLLGFDGIYLNTLDAVSDRDFVIEFLAHCSLIMMHISRLSEELILWSSQEFNFITFDDAFSTGSSIMPQKKNPDVAELGRGKTGRVYGALFSLLTVLKGLPLAYNKDMQEDKEPLFDTIKTVCQTLKVYNPLLATMKVNVTKMHAATAEGFLNATALADYLVKKGFTFRIAHEVVGKMVALCLQKKCKLEELSLQEIKQFHPDLTEEVFRVLEVENIVANSNVNIENELKVAEQKITQSKEWVINKGLFFQPLHL